METPGKRRSNRSRRQPSNFYEDALKSLEAEEENVKTPSSIKTPHSIKSKEVIGNYSSKSEESEDESSGENEDEEGDITEEEEIVSSSDGDVDDDDDEDFETKPQRSKAAKRKIIASPKVAFTPLSKKHSAVEEKSIQRQKQQGGQSSKVQILLRPTNKYGKINGTSRKKSPSGPAGTAARQRAINSSLNTLARKVLEKEELESMQQKPSSSSKSSSRGNEKSYSEVSLVASLLTSHKKDPSTFFENRTNKVQDTTSSQPTTIYTPQLEIVAKRLVKLHNTDPNAAQIALINLLFRSVGGTVETNLDPNEIQVEEMTNDDWGRIITDLADEMRHTPTDCILFCADPDGAIHASAVYDKGGGGSGESSLKSSDVPVPAASLGVREYRKIYEEFFYILGGVALSEGNMSSTVHHDVHEDDEENEYEIENVSDEEEGTSEHEVHKIVKNKGRKRNLASASSLSTKNKKAKTTFTTTTRFDAELVKDLLARVTELVSVGQPDIRAAATTAALYLGHAIVDRTVVLSNKLNVTTRQFAAAMGSGSSKKGNKNKLVASAGSKVESLRHQIDSLKRTRADLEEVLLGPIMKGLFIHRYRDSNWWIRAACIDALSRMMIQRPDLLMMDSYLKYFGWLMSDKAENVRVAALGALIKPFEAAKTFKSTGQGVFIDLSLLEHVATKFLPRLTDCVIDVCWSVQEKAMELLLAFLRNGFLDEVEDENIWNQINLRALEPQTSPAVRRDALYFIMEQLEAFDEDGEVEENSTFDSKNHPRSEKQSAELSHRRISQRLDAIASWAAHALTDGQIPIEKIQIHLVDLLITSLRDMPEHKSIVTNWSAILFAISEDNVATTSQGTIAGDKADVAKQRVLVQMLACAAKAEVGSVVNSSFLHRDIDPDVVESYEKDGTNLKNEKKGSRRGIGLHESLSVALLKALPNLLVKFKSDSAILESLTSLPRYLSPTVFSLPQRKSDFLSLAKNLSEIFLQSSDESVLHNAALSMVFLCSNDHSRTNEANAAAKKTILELRKRITENISDKLDPEESTKSSKSEGNKSPESLTPRRSARVFLRESLSDNEVLQSKGAKRTDAEYGLYLNLKRLRVLGKRLDFSEYLSTDAEDGSKSLEEFCIAIADILKERLEDRKFVIQNDREDVDSTRDSLQHTTMWNNSSMNSHSVVAGSVHEGLQYLLSATAWQVLFVQEKENLITEDNEEAIIDTGDDASVEEDEIRDHIVLTLRKKLINLVEMCYEQYLPDVENQSYSRAQIAWSDSVHESAGRCASDLRTLFPREWANAASPHLRAFAITEDSRLIGGFVRYFRSKELEKLRSQKNTREEDEKDAVLSLLMPLGRSLATNWKYGNRREAGIALAHITGSGQQASNFITTLSRVLKKVDPVRLLEAHMASLRHCYEDWVDNEPEEIENNRPTDAEMEAFEIAEKRHADQFRALEQQALKFSMSLGVRKLSEKLSPALLGFVREGIRFAFSNDDENGEEVLVLGSRLSFFGLLCKYASWIKKNKAHKQVLLQDIEEKERLLKEHEDFHEVHEDDLEALAMFRTSLGLKASEVLVTENQKDEVDDNSQVIDTMTLNTQDNIVDEDPSENHQTVSSTPVTPARSLGRSTSSRRTSSVGSTSALSRMSSVRSSLSPIYEEAVPAGDEMDLDSEASGVTPKAAGSSEKHGINQRYGRTQSTFDGELDVSEDESEVNSS